MGEGRERDKRGRGPVPRVSSDLIYPSFPPLSVTLSFMETALFLRSSASPLEPKVSGARVSGPVGEYCLTGREGGEVKGRQGRKERGVNMNTEAQVPNKFHMGYWQLLS